MNENFQGDCPNLEASSTGTSRCLARYGPIEDWDTSNVTVMSYLFFEKRNFNQDISAWDVSKVTDMSHLFDGAMIFDQGIGAWDVSKVTDMSGMFRQEVLFFESFNKEIGAWDVSKVTDMSYLFANAIPFNQDISAWDVSKVTNMKGMFQQWVCSSCSFRGVNWHISAWNVSKVTDMSNMFFNRNYLTLPDLCWDLNPSVTTKNMFAKFYPAGSVNVRFDPNC